MHITKGKSDWIDVLEPNQEDLEWFKKHFGFHDLIMDELSKPSARAKVEAYENYLFLVYYFPIYDPIEQTSRRTEIDFIITKHQVITIHYEKIEPLASIDVEGVNNSMELAHLLIGSLLNFEERQLKHIQEKVEVIGSSLFKNRESEVLENISRLKRDISEYRVIVRHQEPVLDSLLLHGNEFWGSQSRIYLNELVGINQKIVNQVENFREAITDFEDTNNQIMNLKMNSVMNTFTILSFLTFPFVLMTTLFGLTLDGNPLVNTPNAFWYLLGAMFIGLVSMVAYFIKKKWL